LSASAPATPAAPGARRPRLLVVGPLPPPIGGVETVTQAILESRAFDRFERAHCDTTKGRARQTQGKFDAGNFAWALRHFRDMRAAVRRLRPDVVYLPVAGTWSGFLRDMVLAWIARRSGAALVGHIHGSDFHFVLERRGIQAFWVRAGIGQFDTLLVLGGHWKRLIEAYGIHGRCAIVPSTPRREVFERGARFVRGGDPRPVVEGLFVGQVGRRKGVFDVLAALARCKAAALPFRLTFVGPAELEGEWDAVMRERARLGVEDVACFTGTLQGEELYERFAAADVFVMPSYTEGLPVVFLEAGVFEMPVIATPVGAIPDLVVNEQNGLLVEPGDVAAIAAAITRMTRDAEGRRRMGRRLRQDVEAFHPDRVCARIAEEIGWALDARGRA
jgi:glycosyltransferase involved in cell wall biosynthesis